MCYLIVGPMKNPIWPGVYTENCSKTTIMARFLSALILSKEPPSVPSANGSAKRCSASFILPSLLRFVFPHSPEEQAIVYGLIAARASQ